MFVLIVGCGRVGSAIANSMLDEGHEVSVLDEDAEAIALLDRGQANSWEERGGQFTEGTALEIDALLAAGIEQADAFVASTDGDNTNLVIAQIAQAPLRHRPRRRARARPGARPLVRRAGPADRLPDADGDRAARGGGPRPDPLRGSGGLAMYVVIVGAGKVGWNLARELINKRHEVTVIESDQRRFAVVEQELEHSAQYGDGSELWVLERSGIERADLVMAVTGDDEDNILISPGRAREVRRRARGRALQQPAQPPALRAARRASPVISATDLILRLIEHEVPKYGLVHLLDLPGGAARDHRARGGRGLARRRAGREGPRACPTARS